MSVGIQGIITCEVIHADGSVDTHQFPNMILDSGLDYLCTATNGVFARCVVGTGSTAPAANQVGLVAQVAAHNTIESTESIVESTSSPRYNSERRRFRFNAGSLNHNIAEIGIGPTSGSLFARALTLNTSGVPTAITVTPEDILDVTYELRTYIPTTTVTGTVSIDGVTHNFELAPIKINDLDETYKDVWGKIMAISHQWYLGATVAGSSSRVAGACTGATALAAQTATALLTTIPTPPGGTGAVTVTDASADVAYSLVGTYTPGTFTRTVRMSANLDALNVAGGSFNWLVCQMRSYSFQVKFDPPIPKDATNSLTLDFPFTFARRT